MAENNKMKIKELADSLLTSSSKIVEKLKELGINKTVGGSLDEKELRMFYEATGNKRGLEKLDNKDMPEEAKKDDASKAAPKVQRQISNAASGKSSSNFVIGRRVVSREESSYEPSNAGRNQDKNKGNRGFQSAANSDLRAGYVTRRSTDDYSQMVKNEGPKKNDDRKDAGSDSKNQDGASEEQKVQTVVRRKVRRPAETSETLKQKETTAPAPVEEKIQETENTVVPSAGEEKKEEPVTVSDKKPEEIESPKQEEPVKEEPKPSEEKKVPEEQKKETISEVKKEEKASDKKEEKTEEKPYQENRQPKPQKNNRPPKIEERDGPTFIKKADRSEIKTDNKTGRPGNFQGERKPFDRDKQGQGFNKDQKFGRDQGQQNRSFDKYDKFDKGEKDRDFKPGERSSSRNQGQNRQGGSQRIPSVPSDVQIEEKRERRPQDNAFNKMNKKEKQESAAARNQNASASSKDKYQSARQFIGERKGVSEIFSDDFSLDMENGKFDRRGKKDKKSKAVKQDYVQNQNIAVLTNVKLPETMTVREFAEAIKKSAADVIKKMFMMGTMASQNEVIGFDTAEIIASEFGITAEKEVVVSVEEQIIDDSEDENDENAVTRPPVVVVMGHVDHGKTSLLDAIRSTSVTSGEAGGITQHIGAYTVRLKGRNITFLDTPGHEAFTAMRMRGAMVTDVAILVVAADDGVKPQTIEAINHAKAAKVSIVVAVNKMDKEGANIEKVRQELAEHDVVCEEWGGDVPFIPVSAKKHENIELLLETVLLSADILDLKANPEKQAKGTIIEAKLDKNKGPVATLLVQRGTLKQGDLILSGTVFGKIRTMCDDKGNSIKKAGPSTPVEITGLPEVPEAGEVFYAVVDEHKARQVAEDRKKVEREKMIKTTSKVSLDDLFNQIQEGKMKELNIIVKADVQGSVEAVKQSLEKLSNDEVKIRTIHGAVGAINESDVTLASVSNAIIIGFNVRPVAGIAEHAESMGVDMRLYRVIYDAIDDIQAAMKGMLEPEFKEVSQGTAEIRQIYKVSGIGSIAGSYVLSGKIVRNSNVRIVRNGIVVFEGKLASLKRFKDDAKEVAQGFECGMSFERFNDIKEQDIVECYIMEEIKRD